MTDTVSVAPDVDTRRRLLQRTVGIVGLLAPVLILAPISAASGQEPGFTGDAAAVRAFFASTAGPAYGLGNAVVTLGLLALLWFAIGLALLLAEVEASPAWRSAIGAGSVVAFVGSALHGGWQAASYRADGLTDPLALYAFDVGNLTFANGWVFLGSWSGCVGWVLVSTRTGGRWVGVVALVAGAGLVISRFVWTAPVWFFPYALCWLWVIALSVRLLRQSRPVSSHPEERVR